jgi:hypothetical protein
MIRRSCVDCIFNQHLFHTFTVLVSSAVVQNDFKKHRILTALGLQSDLLFQFVVYGISDLDMIIYHNVVWM